MEVSHIGRLHAQVYPIRGSDLPRKAKSSFVRRPMARPGVRVFVRILSAALLLVVALVAYAVYAEHTAKQRAIDFCARLKVGDSAESLLPLAKASGAD